MKLNSSTFLTRFLAALFIAALFAVSACATGPKLVAHAFSFDGRNDKWASQVDLLEYSYGDQYRMVKEKVSPDRVNLPYQSSVNGSMPVGEFLYVKWRIKATGEVLEDRVDLRNRLPSNMFDHRVTFVIDDKQLYVYLVTPTPRDSKEPTALKSYLTRYTLSYEIYPTNTYKP
jgi:hypothetical protein